MKIKINLFLNLVNQKLKKNNVLEVIYNDIGLVKQKGLYNLDEYE